MTTDKDAPGHRHAHDHMSDLPSDPALRVMTLESLLVEKGLVDLKALAALIDTYEHKTGPRNGARVVARAWIDSAYRERLRRDATARDLGTRIQRSAGRAHGCRRERAEGP